MQAKVSPKDPMWPTVIQLLPLALSVIQWTARALQLSLQTIPPILVRHSSSSARMLHPPLIIQKSTVHPTSTRSFRRKILRRRRYYQLLAQIQLDWEVQNPSSPVFSKSKISDRETYTTILFFPFPSSSSND